MAKKRVVPLHYLPEWIEYRGLSLRRLVQRLETQPGEELISLSSLSRMKKFEQPLTPEVLHALAHAFSCDPEDIIGINPMIEPEVIDLMAVIRKMRMAQDREAIVKATAVLRAIA